MHASIKAPVAEPVHDLRIDLVRGIANWSIFLGHIPGNAAGLLTMRHFGFSGAADVFVFVAGYASAISYRKMARERGIVVAATRILRRAWQLYAAYVALFVLYISTIGYAATQYAAAALIDEYNVSGMVDHPLHILGHGLLLQSKPLNLDLLQLAIVLLLCSPLVLSALLRWPNLAMAGSAALYFAARTFDLGLPSYPDGRWYFNPFCWQLFFVLGAWLALAGASQVRALRNLPILHAAAVAYLVFALAVTLGLEWPQLGSFVPDFLLDPFAANDKQNLPPYRVLHLLLLAVLFTRLVPRDWAGLQWKALQPVIKCGEEWLGAFCAGVFLSFAAHMVLITGPNSLVMQILVSVAGLSAMTAVVCYISWSKRQDRRSTFDARRMGSPAE